MSLKDRLNRLTGEKSRPAADDRQERIAELRRKLDRVMDHTERSASGALAPVPRGIASLDRIVAGQEFRTPHGSFFVCQSVMDGDDLHGHLSISDIAAVSTETAGFVAGLHLPKETSMGDGLFLDTETTGLAGGTGTFPFLIGLGWFQMNSFITCQLFARDFSEESAMLRYLSEIASGKRFLVTFNGRAYDLNLLTTRLILNRCPDTLTHLPHIDLLHPSRRIIAHRLENARLSTIEAHILGVERDGDVPGFEIPERYFNWLKFRDGSVLRDVFAHNKLDIVSMASLLKYLTDLVEACLDVDRTHHGDLLRLASLVHERGDSEKAVKIFEALVSSHHKDVAMSARQSLSLIYKKARRFEEAVSLWSELAETKTCAFFAVEELAKFYEHHTREYGKALRLVRSLLEKVPYLSEGERTSAEYRLRRLLHKESSE